MQAQAAIYDGKGGYTIDEIEVSDPGPGEVLVEIKASGVCHTDHKIMAHMPPSVMGHEGAGVVLKIGSGVTRVKVGDGVLLNWAMSCGRCRACRNGLTNVCENRPQIPVGRIKHRGKDIGQSFGLGTMATATVVPEVAVVRMDSPVPWASACTFGCCVMTGYGTVVNAAKVEAGSSVAVIGAGAVGLCTIQGARISGASTIIALDINPKKLEFAKQFGATHGVLVGKDDPELLKAADEVKKINGGYGVDYCFESTSVPSLCAAPLLLTRNGGTAIQISGTEQKVTIDMTHFEWDKVYMNVLYGKCQPERDFPKLVKHYARGELKIDEMVTGKYALKDLETAFTDMLAGKNAKAVLVM